MGKSGIFAGLRKSCNFCFPPKCREVTKPKAVSKKEMLYAQEVFLEDAGDIPLECHQDHKPVLISRAVFLLRRHRVGN
jgi:hypothetical protein